MFRSTFRGELALSFRKCLVEKSKTWPPHEKKCKKKSLQTENAHLQKKGGSESGSIPPKKQNMTMENPPFEHVFPIEHGDFQACHVSFPGGGCTFLPLIFLLGFQGIRNIFSGPKESSKREKMTRKIPQLECATRWFFDGLFLFGVRRSLGDSFFFFDFFPVSYHRIHHQQGPPFWENIFGSLFPSIEELQIQVDERVFFWEILNFGKDGA